jgi:hypothetical protein
MTTRRITWLLAALAMLALCGPAWGANVFSTDANCVAVWNLDNGALTTDSKGTNTLTNSGVASDAVNFQQGDGSGDFESGDPDYMSIADASLASGFPLKNGDANKEISVCMWVRFESLPTAGYDQYIFNKGGATNYSFFINIVNTGATVQWRLGIGRADTGGNDVDNYSCQSGIAINTWYHVGVTYDDSDKSYRMRVWDDTAGALLAADVTNTAGYHINVEDGVFQLGRLGTGHYFDGVLDEVVVFNDILSADEIDKIRAGTYDAAGGSSVRDGWWWRRRHSN